MVDAQSATAVVPGSVLALLGGIGTLVVLVGTLAGAMEWNVGTGLLTDGVVDLAGDLLAVATGGEFEELTDAAGVHSLWRLLE